MVRVLEEAGFVLNPSHGRSLRGVLGSCQPGAREAWDGWEEWGSRAKKSPARAGCDLADALGDAGDEPGGELGGRLDRAAGIDRLLRVVGEGDDEGEDASGRIARGNGDGGG